MSTSEYTPPPPTAPPPAGDAPIDPPADTPPAGRRVRRGPRSLVSKLTIGVVSLVAVLVLVVGTATYFALRSFLSDKLDEQLQTAVNQGGRNIFYNNPLNGPAPLEVYAVALDPDDGAVLAVPPSSSKAVSAIRIDPDVSRRLAQRQSPDPLTVETNDGLELRVTVRDGFVGDGGGQSAPARVVIGLSTADEHSTLRQLVLLEFVIGGAAVVLALGATTFGVRLSLRRLRRVTTTAEDVAKELSPEGAGLDRRVPDDEPDTEVGQLATSFNTMLAAVETQFAARVESEQRMRQFLADASHELRTPLTSIRGYAELARMQRAVGESGEDNIDRIEFEGTRMSRLVEDLLILARGDGHGDARPMRRELVDVSGLIDDAVSGSRAAFPEREIGTERVDQDAYVIGDPDQLLRVVRNLINNAAVHTAADRPIRIGAAGDDTGVSITVADGGPGLSPEDAAHVFERFWRADKARTRARGGSGLGMSIVASIVRAHGGTVRFDSTVETGSTVTVRLPAVEHG